MKRTRIKICGITRVEDALAVESAGCDALGLVFWPGSKRCVAADLATAIVRSVSPMVTSVGVFVDADIETVARTVKVTGITTAQLCGTMPAGPWRQLAKQVRLIRAIPVGQGGLNDSATINGNDDYLLDTAVEGALGGSGTAFDWSLAAPANTWGRIWLAGGLRSENVAAAIAAVKPYAVDISTGVETAPGVKSQEKIAAFVAAVRKTDQATG